MKDSKNMMALMDSSAIEISVGNNMPILFLLFFIAINMPDLVSRNNNTVIPVLLLANKNKYPSYYIGIFLL
jgi:hypothetical protein